MKLPILDLSFQILDSQILDLGNPYQTILIVTVRSWISSKTWLPDCSKLDTSFRLILTRPFLNLSGMPRNHLHLACPRHQRQHHSCPRMCGIGCGSAWPKSAHMGKPCCRDLRDMSELSQASSSFWQFGSASGRVLVTERPYGKLDNAS